MRVGIVGGGQLARMLALAGHALGLDFAFLDPAPDACAAALGRHLCGAYDDRRLLEALAASSEVVTYEFENVPADAVEFLAARVAVQPNARALARARDRLAEKRLFTELGIPVLPYAAVDTREDLAGAADAVGFPAILKTRTLGYDGKGQALVRDRAELEGAWERLGAVPAILERFVAFERELSVIAVRAQGGEIRFYPLAENTHRGGILRVSVSRPGDPQQAAAEGHARRLAQALDYVGVLALELFEAEGRLLANEMAPRVHNSGHWTIEGAATSQFENHLRAILGLPLGDTRALGHAAMVNFIGAMPERARVLAIPGAHLHDYRKRPRPGRKLGHATARATSPEALAPALERLCALAEETACAPGDGLRPVPRT
jgi:5-(carboxyamino)imidazole ribonucleotide synthase